jgi:D-serine deaminase-like pyridoxal phosphate-dependent protein
MSRIGRLDPATYRIPEEDLERVLTPALVIFVDRVHENLQRMNAYLGGDLDRWRPHVKTTKLPTVVAELVRIGVRNFKCATTREVLSILEGVAGGSPEADVLLAHPLVGPGLRRLAEVARRFSRARISVLAEDPDAVGAIPAELGIFVDVNPGMNRTGILPADGDVIMEVAKRAGERFRGVHYYEGHVREGDTTTRRKTAFALYDDLLGLMRDLTQAGLRIEELVTSGTPTFLHALSFEPFRQLAPTRHRVSPGTVVYHDARSLDITELEFVPAALVLARIVSHPTRGIVTCDAGSKSIAAEAGDPCAVALGWPNLQALTPSEEHLPFQVLSGDKPARGHSLLLLPRHVCPTVNLAEEAVLVQGGRVVGSAPVTARAHELWLGGG